MESRDAEAKSYRSEILHVIVEERNPVEEGAQVLEAPVPRYRRAHAHVPHEVELAARAPGAACQRTCLQCRTNSVVPESSHCPAREAIPTNCDEVDDALADLSWNESLPYAGKYTSSEA